MDRSVDVASVGVRMSNDAPETKVAWVFIRNREMLFVRGKKHVDKNGKEFWINPGGKLESGESHIQALVREAKEETLAELIVSTIRPARREPFVGVTPKGNKLISFPYFAEASNLDAMEPANEIKEFALFTSADAEKTTDVGKQYLAWAKAEDYID